VGTGLARPKPPKVRAKLVEGHARKVKVRTDTVPVEERQRGH
jgi:hypothetical protein